MRSTSASWQPAIVRIQNKFQTNVIVLPDAKDRTSVCSFFWTKHRNVTDGQTDRQTDRQTARSYCSGLQYIASNANAV